MFFFSFKHLGMEYPCAIIRWFDHVGDGPNNTGMWVVRTRNAQGLDPASIKPNESYDKFQFYYVNKFADHHAFEIAS
ncbi:hypothetical protein EDC04DRAFT_2584686 [Pisolithus marmoratus]|nr:hypothetical protein EDC04DRAFT_2584686 [Pisolithus marmoratus]